MMPTMCEHRLRRSLLITPGNRPDRLAKAIALPADAFVFDLEDGVPPDAKPDARRLVVEAARQLDLGGRELCVRVSAIGTPDIDADLSALPLGVIDTLMIPKVERASDLAGLDRRLADLERAAGRKTPLDLIVTLETPRGMLRALDIADASPRTSALFFGSGDYSAATGGALTAAALHVPRSMVVAAAAAAGLQAIDAAFFMAVKDAEATREDARTARELGFSGKLVFHPVQVAVANEVFSPTAEETRWAERVVAAHRESVSHGRGTAMVDGAFVAIDIVLMAQRTSSRARAVAKQEILLHAAR